MGFCCCGSCCGAGLLVGFELKGCGGACRCRRRPNRSVVWCLLLTAPVRVFVVAEYRILFEKIVCVDDGSDVDFEIDGVGVGSRLCRCLLVGEAVAL